MRVLQVSAELFPLLKTGGLADVTGALPAALRRSGGDVRVLLPGFPAILRGLQAIEPLAVFDTPSGGRAALRRGLLPDGVTVAYVIDAPALFDRPGNPYVDRHGLLYADSAQRFALLGYTAAWLAHGLDGDWRPQIVHSHDWHAGLAPAYLRWGAPARGLTPAATAGHRVASVYTVHNLAYQGLFGPETFSGLGLPGAAFGIDGLEFHGQVSFMKAGLACADRLATVSPTYAREIQQPEQGCGLDGLLRARAADLTGILNGVDDAIWNPAQDPLLPFRFDARRHAGKRHCKVALQQSLGLALKGNAPLFGVVSRLAEQKGLPLVLQGMPELIRLGGQLVLLGSGEPALESAFLAMAQAHPASVAVRIGYDETQSHQIFAGTDVTLVPSRFEPCGLTQMYGLKYGSLPLVRNVGGLADTVVDSALENLADGTATGFVFDGYDDASYNRALRRAFALFARAADWQRVQRRAMQQAFDWDSAAVQYMALYQRALEA
jgi:starch synthase